MPRCSICGLEYFFVGHVCPGQERLNESVREIAERYQYDIARLGDALDRRSVELIEIQRSSQEQAEYQHEQTVVLSERLASISERGLADLDSSVRTVGDIIGLGFGALGGVLQQQHTELLTEMAAQTRLLGQIRNSLSNPRRTSADEWYREGTSYLAISDEAEALKRFDEGLREFSGDFRLHYGRGIAFAKQNRLELALQAYSDGLRFLGFPEYAPIRDVQTSVGLLAIGRIHFVCDRVVEAKESLRTALESNGDNEEAAYQLALVYAIEGDWQHAMWFVQYLLARRADYAFRFITDSAFESLLPRIRSLGEACVCLNQASTIEAEARNSCKGESREVEEGLEVSRRASDRLSRVQALADRLDEYQVRLAQIDGMSGYVHELDMLTGDARREARQVVGRRDELAQLSEALKLIPVRYLKIVEEMGVLVSGQRVGMLLEEGSSTFHGKGNASPVTACEDFSPDRTIFPECGELASRFKKELSTIDELVESVKSLESDAAELISEMEDLECQSRGCRARLTDAGDSLERQIWALAAKHDGVAKSIRERIRGLSAKSGTSELGSAIFLIVSYLVGGICAMAVLPSGSSGNAYFEAFSCWPFYIIGIFSKHLDLIVFVVGFCAAGMSFWLLSFLFDPRRKEKEDMKSYCDDLVKTQGLARSPASDLNFQALAKALEETSKRLREICRNLDAAVRDASR